MSNALVLPGHQLKAAVDRGRAALATSSAPRATDGPPVLSPVDRARRAESGLEFNRALDLLRRSRDLSFQAVSNNAGKHELPKSTAHMMCTRDTLPTRPAQVEAFVRACGEPPEQVRHWLAAWHRLAGRGRGHTGQPASVSHPVDVGTVSPPGALPGAGGEPAGLLFGPRAVCPDHPYREARLWRLVSLLLMTLMLVGTGIVLGDFDHGFPGLRTILVAAGTAVLSTVLLATGFALLLLRQNTRT